MEQSELEAKVNKIYRQANEYAKECGGVEFGMTILYGPPILTPKVCLVSLQGGGKDLIVHRTWPERLYYLEDDYLFGKNVRSDFDDAGLQNVLEHDTIASCIAFPQYPHDKGGWRGWLRQPGSRDWLVNSNRWLNELLCLMEPKVIVAYGADAFRSLTSKPRSSGIPVETAAYRIHDKLIPVVGTYHPSYRFLRHEHREKAMEQVKYSIRRRRS